MSKRLLNLPRLLVISKRNNSTLRWKIFCSIVYSKQIFSKSIINGKMWCNNSEPDSYLQMGVVVVTTTRRLEKKENQRRDIIRALSERLHRREVLVDSLACTIFSKSHGYKQYMVTKGCRKYTPYTLLYRNNLRWKLSTWNFCQKC